MSRHLYNPLPKIKLPEDGKIFDHFIIVGVSNFDENIPSILYCYPEDSK